MKQSNHSGRKNLTRVGFLGFLGKIGLLALSPGLPAIAEEAKPMLQSGRKSQLKLRSPAIKGETLSAKILDAKLSSPNLENIRDLLTGRFFGRAAEMAFKDGYKPLIDWNLGTGSNKAGCVLHANIGPPDNVDGCLGFIFVFEETGDIGIFHTITAGIGENVAYDLPKCPTECGLYCPTTCYTKNSIDFRDFVSYPSDDFVGEITYILKTTDVGIIQNELKAVIFSDETLNLGLQHFVFAAHESIAAEIDNTAAGF